MNLRSGKVILDDWYDLCLQVNLAQKKIETQASLIIIHVDQFLAI